MDSYIVLVLLLHLKYSMTQFAVLLSPLQSLGKKLSLQKTKLVYHMINVIAFTELTGKGQAGEML